MINIFGITIHIYGVIIGIAIYVAWEIANKVANRKNLPKGYLDKAAWWIIGIGIVGARIYHVIDYWQRYYSISPIKILYVWEGGLGIWGAIIGGLAGLLIYRIFFLRSGKLNRVNILDVLDSVAVGLPIAQAIGRMGNWVNGELYGKNGEPLFAYETLLNTGLFILLWKMSFKKISSGKLIGIYLIGYGLIRISLENFRPDIEIWKILSVPTAIWMSIIATAIGIFLYRFRSPAHNR